MYLVAILRLDGKDIDKADTICPTLLPRLNLQAVANKGNLRNL
jgi:hypothetical protein